jgi:N-hydroxyarylamine O-acetyltransferase
MFTANRLRMLDLDAYFRRIGYAGSREPMLGTLRALHVHHALAIPFENLDSLLGRPVELDLAALQRKLIEQRRGGYCFEQNLLFAHVLRALNFDVAALVARVVWDRGDDGTRARTHMLLLVQLGEGTYIADVGFGGLTLTAPLRLEPDVAQATPHETFRIVRQGSEFSVEADLRDSRRTLYRFDLQQQRHIDIEVLNYFVSTHPTSPFLTSLMAGRPAHGVRYALLDNRFTTRRANGSTEQRTLESGTELRDVLTSIFGIDVPSDAETDAVLDRLARSGEMARRG